LSFPVAGPYPVSRTEGSNVEVRTRERLERIHLDRVMKCPVDLPSGVEWAAAREKPISKPRQSFKTDTDFVIDRFVSHTRDEGDNEWLVRVR
jgi:hypothetical protein